MSELNNAVERELGWDDTIEKESEFILLPEGEYDFQVVGFERSRFDGSEKMPPCNSAKLRLKIDTKDDRNVEISTMLFLHSKTEWVLSAFFTSIGQKKKGEPLQMNWNKVFGAKGRCKLRIKNWDGKQFNEVARYLEPKADSNTGYKAGEF